MRIKLFFLLICLLPGGSFAQVALQKGKATFYAKAHNGHRTTSGERYNPEELTAAHATLPLHSYVQVHNLENGRSVVVRVNDRMSRKSRYIIDVSKKAAQKLGIVGAGMGQVKLIQVDKQTALSLQKAANKET
ncbi:septal ring lytic transglycosylase RlpA family protein [Rufibacter sediminis]|uniref:Probable endolytic peptidoglycan transglycosylase RlpA n=1 Tax=Rufibacter sediminis TaxID=2762756 RepID=A0ABR6VTK0_9BACT|nr:septal ring lytic transglycosylase RlpA family protein [Rufibacter sediminis]MBC3540217.1 septal ring lytic transglycosylase RlpA family protein [Rufibacter sediminis]